MTTTLQSLISDFHGLKNTDEITDLAGKFSLVEVDHSEHHHPQILGIYKGSVAGCTVKLTHRWYDPSQAFSIQPDINKLSLEIEGKGELHTEFQDKF